MDLEYTAKIVRKGGYWFVIFENGTIELGTEVEDQLDLWEELKQQKVK